MKKNSGYLTDVTEEDLKLLETPEGTKEFWKHVKIIDNFAFRNLSTLKEITIPNTVVSINDSAFYNCYNLEKVTILSDAKIKNSFVNNCLRLKKIDIQLKGGKASLPIEIFSFISAEELRKYSFEKIEKFFNDILNKFHFYNDKSNLQLILPYFKFAESLGCFSDANIKLNNGGIVNISDKAFSVFDKLLKNYFKDENIFNINKIIPYSKHLDVKTDDVNIIHFLNFIGNESNDYSNFNSFIKTVTNFEKKWIYEKIVNNFTKIATQKSKNGKSWYSIFGDYILSEMYPVDRKDVDAKIYNALKEKGIYVDKVNYKKTLELFNIIENSKLPIPEHILGKPLSGKADNNYARDRITSLVNENRSELIKGLAGVEFTYEMLSKRDLMNAFIGKLKTRCCCSIDNETYGCNIAEATLLAPNVQNLVIHEIKNGKKDIIGKATMLLNKREGYILVNEFDVNDKYKISKEEEFINDSDGSQKRAYEKKKLMKEEIFHTFMTGIHDFINEYNKTHKTKITQVNVGGRNSYNKFTDILDEKGYPCVKMGFPEKDYIKSPTLYHVKYKSPKSIFSREQYNYYSFNDTTEDQYVLYKSENKPNTIHVKKWFTKSEKAK